MKRETGEIVVLMEVQAAHNQQLDQVVHHLIFQLKLGLLEVVLVVVLGEASAAAAAAAVTMEEVEEHLDQTSVGAAAAAEAAIQIQA